MTTPVSSGKPVNGVLATSALGLALSLGIAGYHLLTQGHAAFNTRSVGMNWGLAIVTYDYFVVMSTGLAFIGCLQRAFGWRAFEAVAKRSLWLALATLLAGGAALMLELGHPLRALYAIPLGLQYHSPMFWKVLFIGAYVILLVALFAQVQWARWSERIERALATGLVVALLGVVLTAGALFGMISARPFWFGGLVPAMFMVESLLGAVALTILVSRLVYGIPPGDRPTALQGLLDGPLPRGLAALIAVMLLMVGTRSATGLWSSADGLQVWHRIVTSPWFYLEVGAGLGLPLVLMLTPLRTRAPAQAISAMLVLIGLFIGRYEFIVGGQLVPLFKGNWAPGFIAYTPSITEWMLALLSLSLTFVVYGMGERYFDLSAPATRQR